MNIEEHRQTLTRSFNSHLREATAPVFFQWDNPARPLAEIGGEPRGMSGFPFKGENALQLAMVAKAQGFTSPRWLTVQQANACGGRIRKGQVATKVLSRVRTSDGGFKEVLMNYFNEDQISGLNLPVQQELTAEQLAVRQAGLHSLIARKKRTPTPQQYNNRLRELLNERFPPASSARDNAKAAIRREFALMTAQARLGLPRTVDPTLAEELKPLMEDRLHWMEVKTAMEQANKALADIGIQPLVYDRIERKVSPPEVKPAEQPKGKTRARSQQKGMAQEAADIPF